MDIVYCLDTLRVKKFAEISLSLRVKEIQANFVFSHFFEKFENSKWPSLIVRIIVSALMSTAQLPPNNDISTASRMRSLRRLSVKYLLPKDLGFYYDKDILQTLEM